MRSRLLGGFLFFVTVCLPRVLDVGSKDFSDAFSFQNFHGWLDRILGCHGCELAR